MIKYFCSTLILATVTICNVNAQKVSVSKGQKAESVAVMKMKMNMEMMGQTIENSTETTTTTDVEVKDVTDQNYLFTNTVRHLVLKAMAMNNEINFDSDKKEDMEGQMGDALKDVIGKPQDVTVDKQSKIVDIKGGNEDKAAGMSQMMASDMTKGQPFPFLTPIPAKQVKPGDSWVDSSGTADKVKTVFTYTLKEINGDNAVLTYTGTMLKSGTVQQGGMDIQIDLKGNITGDATYEASTGLLKKSTSNIASTGTMGIMGQNVPLTMNITNVTTLAKK